MLELLVFLLVLSLLYYVLLIQSPHLSFCQISTGSQSIDKYILKLPQGAFHSTTSLSV